MTDREMVELAAKAAGLAVQGWTSRFGKDEAVTSSDYFVLETWNPLHHDDQAFRLAVKFRMDLRIQTLPHAVYVQAGNGRASSALEMLEHKNAETVDENAATRRAIVRAAAEIGSKIESR